MSGKKSSYIRQKLLHKGFKVASQFIYAQLFYIQNRKMCLSKKILFHFWGVFLPCLEQFLSEKFDILNNTKKLKKI